MAPGADPGFWKRGTSNREGLKRVDEAKALLGESVRGGSIRPIIDFGLQVARSPLPIAPVSEASPPSILQFSSTPSDTAVSDRVTVEYRIYSTAIQDYVDKISVLSWLSVTFTTSCIHCKDHWISYCKHETIFLWYLPESLRCPYLPYCALHVNRLFLSSLTIGFNLPTHFTAQHEDNLSPTPAPTNTCPNQRRHRGGGRAWVLWTHYPVLI